jgi:hypothetical protein
MKTDAMGWPAVSPPGVSGALGLAAAPGSVLDDQMLPTK